MRTTQPVSWASDLVDVGLNLAEPGTHVARRFPAWLVALEDVCLCCLGLAVSPGISQVGDHPDRELALPGVKALVAATHHVCPRLETSGGSPCLQGSLDPP